MTPALNHYEFLISRHAKGRFAVLSAPCKNDFYKEILPIIPEGTVMKIDFGCDSGLYAVADVNGVTHKVKINVHEYHKVKLVQE